MALQVVPLHEGHLEDAAGLAGARYREFRDQVPLLPPRYGETTTLLPLLRDMLKAGPGVAAIRQGRLVGFLTGWLMPSFRGRRAVFSPEWAHAADPRESRYAYEEMYTCLAASWVEGGYPTHLISTLAGDRDDMDVWHWLGFGMIAVDALRGLEPISGPSGDVDIRRGELGDVEQALSLGAALQRHMASAPTFLSHATLPARRDEEEWLADPAHALWLAYDGTEVAAFMKQGPANEDACTIIRDEKTTSIVGAFTREGMRGQGVAAALLNRALEWARRVGYERCAVDFEPMNPSATRFWLKHFRPVCYTLVRYLTTRAT